MRGYPPHSNRVLPIGDALFQLTEAFEFASRLALTEAGAETMVFEADLRNLNGHMLWVDDPNRSSMDHAYTYSDPALSLTRELPRQTLVGEAWDLAVAMAIDLYARFGWSAPKHIVEGQQGSLRRPT
jgi:hypothetical protein